MDLTPNQKDALTELINIGYGRAAGALSEMTGYRISLEVPRVSMHPINEIGPILEGQLSQSVASVNQRFSGPVSGNALLLLSEASAIVLSRLLSEDRNVARDFDSNAKEIITEVGNILLNACLGIFGNLLQIHVSFSVPSLSVENVSKVIHHAARQAEELSFGLMIQTRFHVKEEDVTGYLVIVLGITSLDRLLQELKAWEERQLG
jgi:chemotaxis protein CheC